MTHALLYMHQTSHVCAGMCMCNRTHQTEKTDFISQRERNVLTCFNEKVHNKMSKWKLSLFVHVPSSPYFSIYDQHKCYNFEMVALSSSYKLHGFCI